MITNTAVFKNAVFGGSFNPPGRHHYHIVSYLLHWFSTITIVPCGISRKDSLKEVSNAVRKELVLCNFGKLQYVNIDTYDLDNDVFTPTYDLAKKYQQEYVDTWHIIGSDLVIGGRSGDSEIQRLWKNGNEIWYTLKFAVVNRSGFDLTMEDLPPQSVFFKEYEVSGSSQIIRERIARNEDVSGRLQPEVYKLIKDKKLYQTPS